MSGRLSGKIAIVTGGTVSIQFSNLPAGQYVIEQTTDLGASWTSTGNTFSETSTDAQITPTGTTQQFFRLVRLP